MTVKQRRNETQDGRERKRKGRTMWKVFAPLRAPPRTTYTHTHICIETLNFFYFVIKILVGARRSQRHTVFFLFFFLFFSFRVMHDLLTTKLGKEHGGLRSLVEKKKETNKDNAQLSHALHTRTHTHTYVHVSVHPSQPWNSDAIRLLRSLAVGTVSTNC